MIGFNYNIVLQQTIDDLIKKVGVTSFIETGTYYAASTTYMALQHPTLPIFTCEIDPNRFTECVKKLSIYPNVSVSMESSEKFIERLIDANILGTCPMFFLDAHWFDYWPLLDEVTNIVKLSKFIILIDDFEVPGQSQFETSAGGGGTLGEERTIPDNRPCNMNLIGHLLPQDCKIIYPKYSKYQIFGNQSGFHLVGYVFIMTGIHKSFCEPNVNHFLGRV